MIDQIHHFHLHQFLALQNLLSRKTHSILADIPWRKKHFRAGMVLEKCWQICKAAKIDFNGMAGEYSMGIMVEFLINKAKASLAKICIQQVQQPILKKGISDLKTQQYRKFSQIEAELCLIWRKI